MKVHQIPGKLEVEWREDVNSMWDKWYNYNITLEEFTQAIMEKGVSFARSHRAIAWIADASIAKGVFADEIQEFITKKVFEQFAKIGIKYFISVQPQSALTKLGVKRYESQVGPKGITLVEAKDIDAAIAFLKEKAGAK